MCNELSRNRSRVVSNHSKTAILELGVSYGQNIKVLVVDNLALVRKLLTNIINETNDLEVIDTAADPYIVRDKIHFLKLDVLTLDIEVPKMDGVTFLKNLMRCPEFILLVRNMPLENPALYGRLKDHLAVLCDAADRCVHRIRLEQAVKEQQSEVLGFVITHVEQQLWDLKAAFHKHEDDSFQIMNNLLLDFEQSFVSLGLTGEQEENLLNLARDANTRVTQQQNLSLRLEEAVTGIVDRLYELK